MNKNWPIDHNGTNENIRLLYTKLFDMEYMTNLLGRTKVSNALLAGRDQIYTDTF